MNFAKIFLGIIFFATFSAERSNAQAPSGMLTFGGCEQHMAGSRYLFQFETSSRNYVETWLNLRFLDTNGRLVFSSAPIVRARMGEPFVVRFSNRAYCNEWAYIFVSEIPQNNAAFPDFYYFGVNLQLDSLSPYCHTDYCLRRTD